MTSIEVTNEDVKKLNQLDRIEAQLKAETIKSHYRNLSNEDSRIVILGSIIIGVLFIFMTTYDIKDYGREHLDYNLIAFFIYALMVFAVNYMNESIAKSNEKKGRIKNAEEYFEIVPKIKGVKKRE